AGALRFGAGRRWTATTGGIGRPLAGGGPYGIDWRACNSVLHPAWPGSCRRCKALGLAGYRAAGGQCADRRALCERNCSAAEHGVRPVVAGYRRRTFVAVAALA